jgi:TolB-like protein
LSRAAYEQVKGKLSFAVKDLGEQRLKNIAEPVRAYAVLIAGEPSQTRAGSISMPSAAIAPRLSIVVLPFANLNRDPELDYFVDGLAEDLTTELSRLPGFFVIARSTALTFKGQSVLVKQVAHELGVRYVLEGSVRKVGQRVRVTVQLIDAESAAHLWADRFDRDLSDILDLQDAIALELASVLDVRLVEAESHHSERSSHPDAVDRRCALAPSPISEHHRKTVRRRLDFMSRRCRSPLTTFRPSRGWQSRSPARLPTDGATPPSRSYAGPRRWPLGHWHSTRRMHGANIRRTSASPATSLRLSYHPP